MAKVGRINLGSQGLEVSAQGLGCYNISGGYGTPKPEPDNIALIHHAIHSGVTFLDTSDIYGPHTNEILLGKAENTLLDSKKSELPGYAVLNTSKGSIIIDLYKDTPLKL
ncbi:hypothetical protein K1719_020933 [Acacia pycnantha]|nr:hypothetical protein K1719_020933 [Acacia pycnantha]